MQVLTVINQKGGIGKTTAALNIGAALRHSGYKVLYIDTDQQSSLTNTLLAGGQDKTLLDILIKHTPAEEAIAHTELGDIIPSHTDLAAADIMLYNEVGKEYLLKEAIAPIRAAAEYDYIIIDTPPVLSTLTINALTAADRAIIPLHADIYSLDGLGQVAKTINTVKQRLNPALTISGVVITLYDARGRLEQDIAAHLEELAAAIGTKLYNTKIRRCKPIKEAQSYGKDLFTYAPKSNGAADYRALTAEIIEEG